jgi:hypothetical protein
MIKSFINYVYYRNDIGNPIGNDWLLATSDMLDEFRTDLTQVLTLWIQYIVGLHQ